MNAIDATPAPGSLVDSRTTGAKILGTGYYLGTGLISVMGTSFTFLPIAREMVIRAITDAQAEGKCDCTPGTADDGSATCGFPFDCKGYGMEGYGRFLGTAMVAAFLEVVIALMPSKMRQKMFPPVVTGVAVMLIGASLIAAGIKYVGGGVFCAENDLAKSAALPFGPQLCNENGNVMIPFGSPEYVGLAFSDYLRRTPSTRLLDGDDDSTQVSFS